ncbi:MAG: zinc ribbon domain-containing protein [Armatimonadota bacterium]|nr:zinc ribbon domain-containing protein [bacterium]MDW8322446.1 zinc ribbon domain-containing protein [Armatimonadota bacterium]
MITRWIALILMIIVAVPLAAQPRQPIPVRAYQIEAVNRDVREVLDDLFQKAGKQYVIEPGVQGNVSLRIATDSFEEALNRVLQSAGLICQIEQSQAPQGRVVATYVVRARPAPLPLAAQTPVDILSRPVNLMASTKLRNVLAMLSQQTGVSIVATHEVPDLEVTRLVLNNVTLGYALNVIAQATRTQYQFQPDGSILLVPAPQIQVKVAPGITGTRQFVDPTILRTPPAAASGQTQLQQAPAPSVTTRRADPPVSVLRCVCGADLQPYWNYCPMCGKKIMKIQPAQPKR